MLTTIFSLMIASTPAIAQEYSVDEFKQCIATLKPMAINSGVRDTTFNEHTKNLKPNISVLPRLNKQPEFTWSLDSYLTKLLSISRVVDGIEMMKNHNDLLLKIEQKYNVNREFLVAIWGVETNYGKNIGSNNLLESLLALSCEGRRQDFFRKEFFSTLRIIQANHIEADKFIGSWAGAFGQTQFMPTTFERIAVDFDGDGKKDLIGNIGDALASSANYLKKSGFEKDLIWGFEVKVPKEFNYMEEGRTKKKNIEYWRNNGIKLVNGDNLLNMDNDFGLIKPDKESNSFFLVTKNFDAIYKYNPSLSYALAIAKLSDQFKKKDF